MDEPVRILFVDDDKNVLSSLGRVFMDDEYEILTASSGHEGLSVLRREPLIRLVVSDFRMPGMNGVEFLKEVYKCWPKTVRMVLSGQADTSSIAAAIKEGHIHKFIAKPWDEDELKGAISDALEKFFGGIRNAA